MQIYLVIDTSVGIAKEYQTHARIKILLTPKKQYLTRVREKCVA